MKVRLSLELTRASQSYLERRAKELQFAPSRTVYNNLIDTAERTYYAVLDTETGEISLHSEL